MPWEALAMNSATPYTATNSMAPSASSHPFMGRRLPTNTMATIATSGTSGISQAKRARAPPSTRSTASPAKATRRWVIGSPSHQVQFVDVGRRAVAEDEHDDRQADADLGGGDGDHEQREHLADPQRVLDVGAEGDEVDVHRGEHEFHRQQHEHRVVPHQHAVDADREQQGGEDEELADRHRSASLRASTMPPMSAASSTKDTASNGIT